MALIANSLRKTVGLFLAVSMLIVTDVAATADQEMASWLFVQVADSGTLAPITDDPVHYTLTLKSASPYMLSFTDRPNRGAKIEMTNTFVNDWHMDMAADNYRDNPPNATLVISPNKFEDMMVFCLEDPVFDEKAGTISYKATPIKCSNTDDPKFKGCTMRTEMPKTFGPSVLFIDDSWGSLGG